MPCVNDVCSLCVACCVMYVYDTCAVSLVIFCVMYVDHVKCVICLIIWYMMCIVWSMQSVWCATCGACNTWNLYVYLHALSIMICIVYCICMIHVEYVHVKCVVCMLYVECVLYKVYLNVHKSISKSCSNSDAKYLHQ